MELATISRNNDSQDKFYQKKKLIIKALMREFEDEWSIVGGLGAASKMPGFTYSTPANACITGAELVKVEGSVCHGCYAMRANYKYPNVVNALSKRVSNLTHPFWVPSMVKLIFEACSRIEQNYFRFHDSGDLQGVWHLQNIIDIANLTPNINYWLPTREYKMVKDINPSDIPKNLSIRLSAHMIDGKAPDVGLPTSTVSSSYTPITSNSKVCQAYLNNNQCGSCRECWHHQGDITYRKH